MARNDHDLFNSVVSKTFSQCLHGNIECQRPAIKSHSLQKSKTLKILGPEGHVYHIAQKFPGHNDHLQFRKVGIGQASIFNGFCKEHDNELFKAIDDNELSLSNTEQLFLLAYRAISKELHRTIEECVHSSQFSYSRIKDLHDLNTHNFNMNTLGRKMAGLYNFRAIHFSRHLEQKRFTQLRHSTFEIVSTHPSIACSAFFSIKPTPYGEKFSGTCINVIPTSPSRSVVVFSYPKCQSAEVRRYISPICCSDGEERRFRLSRLIIHRANNFFVSPRQVEQWSDVKKNRITSAFARTAAIDCSDWAKWDNCKELQLF